MRAPRFERYPVGQWVVFVRHGGRGQVTKIGRAASYCVLLSNGMHLKNVHHSEIAKAEKP